MKYDNKQLFLKPEEAKFLSMAVVAKIEELHISSQNQLINWNPEARKMLKEMIEAGKTLKIKMEKIGIDMRPLPPFEDGDQDEFITKQS